MNATLDAALDYISRGWIVLPLKPNLKEPAGDGWRQQDYGVTTDQAAKIWCDTSALNIGIVTGERSGIWVLDIDPDHDGEASLQALQAGHGDLPQTFTVQTRSGGRHLYFKYVDGLRNSAGRVGKGIDVRAEGGYVVAPPSAVGALYRVLDDSPVAVAPQWLVSLAEKPVVAPSSAPEGVRAPGEGGGFSQAYTASVVAREVENVLTAAPGEGNNTLNIAAFNLGTLVGAGALDAQEAAQALFEAATRGGRRPGRETAGTIKSGLEAGALNPRQAPDFPAGGVVFTDFAPLASDTAIEDYAAQVAREALRMQIREDARILLEERKAGDIELPCPVSLLDLLAEPDEEQRWIVDGLLSAGGKFLLAAQRKAGKTTMVGNLVRSLVDGTPYLGRFATEPVGRVMVLDIEMNRSDLRRWYRDLGPRNPEGVTLLPMRGKASTFNILVPKVRARWVEIIRGFDVVILDCLRPFLDALGLDENHDAGRFLEAFDALMTEAGVPSYGIVHHMGHGGERSRGDSRIIDWPDAVWNLRTDDPDDPTSARYFMAYGRDVGVPEAMVSFEVSTRSLTYHDMVKRSGNKAVVKAEKIRLALLKHVTGGYPAEFKAGDLARLLRDEGIPFSKGDDSGETARLVKDGLFSLRTIGNTKLYSATPDAMAGQGSMP